jgi:predicted house-cleaning noncanonical NTP pyrophosphatase (MazG superfamily)
VKITYNKLVRDNIPEIIQNNNSQCSTRVLNDSEYYEELKKKLIEETNEFCESDEVSELGDILEVFNSIIKCKNLSFSEIDKIRENKKKKNGAFEKKLLLEWVEDGK